MREHLSRYEKAGIDQVMFVQQSGANLHEHICESLEIFASEVMPEFKEREEARAAEKRRELAPYIEAALARKPRMPPIDDAESRESKPSGARRRRRSWAQTAAARSRSPPKIRSPGTVDRVPVAVLTCPSNR